MEFSVEKAKMNAAIASTELVRNGQIVGLGSGSTVYYMLKELGRRICEEQLRIIGVATSYQTAELATEFGIPLTALDDHPKLDIAIDGADQVDPQLDLIKGMGGALTREKIVGRAAETLVIIVDEGKMVSKLGINQGIPVEVIPFAVITVLNTMTILGGKPTLRYQGNKGDLFVTDNGNNIIDVDFGAIDEAKRLEKEIKMLSGVVESGLFVDMARIVFVGDENGVKRIERGGEKL